MVKAKTVPTNLISEKFCNTYKLSGSNTYNALMVLDRNGIIALVQHFNFRTKIQFITSNTTLFSYLENHMELNTVVKVLLRTYGGIFDYDTKVDLNLVVTKCNLPEKNRYRTVTALRERWHH
jgi:ATP-dependent DNA helicase RecQ